MAKQTDPKPRAIDPQNRVVLPREVMKALALARGDFVTFEVAGSEVRMHKVRWILERK